jgi:CheY-like chemotaxis protein/predicted regulator of Ras-like GTPase activity (Roadblock/LC7/MglB family)
MPKRVLIVDDDKEILLMLDFALKKLGPEYDIITATGSIEALEMVQQADPFDLVVTDYVMKEITGVDLARAVRRISPKTPVILMTAYGTKRLRATTESLGFDGYLDKPFTVQKIRGIVQQMVHVERKVPEDMPEPEPMPTEDMSEHLKALQINANARCVLLLRSDGYPVQVAGDTRSLNLPNVSALIAANVMSAGELAHLLGNEEAFRSSYHEGGDFNVYAYNVNDTFLLAVVFDANRKSGVVWFYTKQTALVLAPLLAGGGKEQKPQ